MTPAGPFPPTPHPPPPPARPLALYRSRRSRCGALCPCYVTQKQWKVKAFKRVEAVALEPLHKLGWYEGGPMVKKGAVMPNSAAAEAAERAAPSKVSMPQRADLGTGGVVLESPRHWASMGIEEESAAVYREGSYAVEPWQ